MSTKIGKIDDTKVRSDVDSHKGSSKFYKLQEGPNYVRFLPPLEGLVTPGTYYGLHHQHGMKIEGGFRSMRCLHDHENWCPFCAMADFFRSQGDDDNARKRARACFSSAKYYLNVLIGHLRSKEIHADEDLGIVLLQISNSLFEKCDQHRHSEWGDFTDPEHGYWLNIQGTGEGTSRRYPNVSPSRFNMGKLPEWVDFAEAHDLTSEGLLPTKQTKEMVMLLVDRYGSIAFTDPKSGESVSVTDILRKSQSQWKKKRGR